MGSRGSRGRGPGSLGEPGRGDLGGLLSPDLGLDVSLIILVIYVMYIIKSMRNRASVLPPGNVGVDGLHAQALNAHQTASIRMDGLE
jgi:hypothetical protein